MKKGFTLTELLAIIVILAIIVTMITTDFLGIFSSSKESLNQVQKNQIKEAVNLYINDFCLNPLNSSKTCMFETKFDEDGVIQIKGSDKTLGIEILRTNGYFGTDELKHCSGTVKINNDGSINLNNVTCNL